MSENPFAILTREPVPDSCLDVEAVIAGGRARVRRRRGASVVAAAVAVALVVGAVAVAQQRPGPRPDPVGPAPSPSQSPSSRCAPAPLTQLGPSVYVTVDASGRYIVGIPDTADGTVILYGPGGTQTLTTVPRLLPDSVNGSGTIIGNVANDVDADGYVVDGDTTTALGKPPGALNVRANGINDAGDIVGDARMPGGKFRAVVWRHGKWNQPQLLSTPTGGQAGGQSAAHGISTDGRIVGSVGNGAQPYLWQADGTGQALPTPQGKPGGLAARVVGDWADGPVDYLAGTTVRPSGRRVATAPLSWARWNLRTGEVREVQTGPQSAGASGLLPDGTVVLNVTDGTTLWTETGTTKLPVPAGYDRTMVTGAGSNGLLVGTALQRNGKSAPFRWACHQAR
ncbi:hypothetical protein ABZS66_36035 [Dactylosporangium sp. NPDC005572]|uniref:hypothetical protein n=1 Tax=Dactylosporangium sp. NPDC005572 TaxID=3156889 RepID=UPI0033B6DD72